MISTLRKIVIGTLAFSLCACYESTTKKPISSSNVIWTGTAEYNHNSSAYGGNELAIGLAGNRVYLFNEYGAIEYKDDVLSREFNAPYNITSMTRTNTDRIHTHTFYHANLVGKTNNLDLFYVAGSALTTYANERIRPSFSGFYEDNKLFYIRQICEISAFGQSLEFVTPTSENSHLIMSVRTCAADGTICTGGVVELEFTSYELKNWRVKSSNNKHHAIVRKQSGNYFSDECMPIDVARANTTNKFSAVKPYMVVGDPSIDDINIIDLRDFKRGIISKTKIRRDRKIVDISIETSPELNDSVAFIQVLSSKASDRAVDHFAIYEGNISELPFLSENVRDKANFIQAHIGNRDNPGNNTNTTGALFVLGENGVDHHRYRRSQ